MLFSDDDPFAPTMEQRQGALGVIAGLLGSLVAALLTFDALDIDLPPSVMQTIIAFALVVVVMGPKHVAWFVNVFSFLRNGRR